MLQELHLRSFQHHLKDFQQQAIDKTWSYTDFLTAIFQEHSPTWFSPPFPQAGRC